MHMDWNMVVHLKALNFYNMCNNDNISYKSELFQPVNFENFFPEGDDNLPIV